MRELFAYGYMLFVRIIRIILGGRLFFRMGLAWLPEADTVISERHIRQGFLQAHQESNPVSGPAVPDGIHTDRLLWNTSAGLKRNILSAA